MRLDTQGTRLMASYVVVNGIDFPPSDLHAEGVRLEPGDIRDDLDELMDHYNARWLHEQDEVRRIIRPEEFEAAGGLPVHIIYPDAELPITHTLEDAPVADEEEVEE
jgi:hypothetical protein